MFSSCRDKCIVCRSFDEMCLAGHGDDDFCRASKEQLIKRLSKEKYDEKQKRLIKNRLSEWYDYEAE